ncbi:hypothetical protein FPV67DRAFT_603049 [Lyophyllum atratum]|nr:hypothetical protein FPV67DRAFT_603049 [Lyophyllum atratum]
MGIGRKKPGKRRSAARKASLLMAQSTYQVLHRAGSPTNVTTMGEAGSPSEMVARSALDATEMKLKKVSRKFKNERQRNGRVSKANGELQKENKELKTQNSRMRWELDHARTELTHTQAAADAQVLHSRHEIHDLKDSRRKLLQEVSKLRKKAARFREIKERAVKQALARAAKKGRTFQLMQRGMYTAQARKMARYMVSTGTSEAKVGDALREIGELLGVHIERTMSQRTVQRAVLEGGVAADIQLGYEMSTADSKPVLMIVSVRILIDTSKNSPIVRIPRRTRTSSTSHAP